MAQNQAPIQQMAQKVVKATTAVTVSGSLIVLSGLTIAMTVVGIAMATPVLIVFSPVLAPAAITIMLIGAGFLTSGGLGATASFVLYWMYRYVTGEKPVGAGRLDRTRVMVHAATKEAKDQFGQDIKGGQPA